MLPHEAQELMAKVLFGIFAISMVCMMRARAAELPQQLQAPSGVVIVKLAKR